MDSNGLICLRGICRTFDVGGRPVYALVDIDEEIAGGEHVAVMGPSGSGKSTLLNIIGCLDRPTSGSYQLGGSEVGDLDELALSEVRRHQIGFVFQSYHLVPRLDASGNVELPMVFAGVPRAARRQRVATALDTVDMADRADHRPDQLSGGERQRVAIARATVMGPSILLADEPTGNLDTNSGRQVLDLLDHMNDEGLTLLVVTHNPAVARRADRVIIMRDGAIVRRVAGDAVKSFRGIGTVIPGETDEPEQTSDPAMHSDDAGATAEQEVSS